MSLSLPGYNWADKACHQGSPDALCAAVQVAGHKVAGHYDKPDACGCLQEEPGQASQQVRVQADQAVGQACRAPTTCCGASPSP